MKMSMIHYLAIGGIALGAYLLYKHAFSRGIDAGVNLDVSRNEDLAGGCAHLISLEEHLSSSFAQTGDQNYLDQMQNVRGMRRDAMSQLLPTDAPAENWCITKHLLGGSMRMNETGSKYLSEGNKDAAAMCFSIAMRMKNGALEVAMQETPGAQCSVCQNG